MSLLLKNIIRFFLFIFIQVYILDKIPMISRFAKPYLYYLFLLWLPYTMPRLALLGVGFVFGLTMDYFTGTPGYHASACVLIAYLRPFLLNVLLPQEKSEISYLEPGVKSLGFPQYAAYIFIMTFIHNACLVFIDWMSFGDILYFLIKVICTTAISMLLVAIAELLFLRKSRFKTNTAY